MFMSIDFFWDGTDVKPYCCLRRSAIAVINISLLSAPPVLSLWRLLVIKSSGRLCYPVSPCLVVCYHLIDLPPVGKSAEITVINEYIGLYLTGEALVALLPFSSGSPC